MIKNANVKEIKLWPVKNGYHVCPTKGDDVSLGDRVSLGDHVSLGDDVSLGNGASLGDGVSLPIYNASNFPIHWYSLGKIKSCCIIKPFAWWEENIIRCAEENGYSKTQQVQYQLFVRQIIEWEKAMGDLIRKKN